MEKAVVYSTDFRATASENLLQKFRRLCLTAGMEKIDFRDKFVAIKIHFGEPGNLAYLRANYAKVMVDLVKEFGGKPFLTDCNTLYVGGRKNALDHLDAAYLNGYSPFSTGCHVIIGDGLKGTDETLIPIDGEYIKEAKVGRAVMDADIILSLSHFKAHECTGMGGAIKNIGMGCGSRAGKMEMHNAGKPCVDASACVGCKVCPKVCAHDAITIVDKKASIDHSKCVGCGRCIGVCFKDAIAAPGDESNDILNYKIAEYTMAILKDKPHFHVSLVCDVSPFCDCHAENDMPIISDVGMFASFDPVALDQACTEEALKMPVMPGSLLDSKKKTGDHFCDIHPTTDWRGQMLHAEKCGVGTTKYELKKI